ncbi:hypothetical protein HYU90_01830 [Candidatus Collierbacteria bacterium]|nr:hypothetical protein [Candidatus Collierbacteria bacterium]
MKTLIQTLFPNRTKVSKRRNRGLLKNLESWQFYKMAKLGQTLVVMSR